jgi:3-methylfumaryl-CoA hydratase
MDQMNLSAWIDRGTTLEGGVSAQSAACVHAVLGQHSTDAPCAGDVLPHLWHWFAFPPKASMEELGEDGHPRMGGFMPPLHLKRRMWAGGNLEFHKPLHVGESLTRVTRIANISEKAGAAGDIIVISLDHEIHGEDGLAITERQNIVYIEIPDSYKAPKAIAAPQEVDISEDVATSSPLLMRYSAITFNAHRIHYDLPYTSEVEHYPDLVVHGPLQANLIMDQAIRHRGHAPTVFSYRGVHPLFLRDALSVQTVKSSEAEWSLCTVAGGAHQCMQASAIWAI